MNTENPIGKW